MLFLFLLLLLLLLLRRLLLLFELWHESHNEKCYCTWDGKWTDCQDLKKKCYWDGKGYDAGRWHESHNEKCYCTWDGKWTNCEDLHHDDDDCKTIAKIACDNSNFSMLCKALKKAGLFSTLDDKHADFTVFAPSNDAFEGFLEWRGLDDIKLSRLENILLTHVVTDHVIDKDDLKNRCSELLRMASNEKTRTICQNGKSDLFQKGNGNSDLCKPRIISADIQACNGIVHVVDEVILP
eukprot:jgi/Psemu1/238856/estExt_Genewise1.C_1190013